MIVIVKVTKLDGYLRIHEELAKRGWGSRTWLARQMRVTRALVTELMLGKSRWTAEHVARAAQAFGLTEDELFAPAGVRSSE